MFAPSPPRGLTSSPLRAAALVGGVVVTALVGVPGGGTAAAAVSADGEDAGLGAVAVNQVRAAAPKKDIVARPGSRGAVVTAVDLALRVAEKKAAGRATRTGRAAVLYGPETTTRVKAFQKRSKLAVTGVVDETTYARLRPAYTLKAGVQRIGTSVRGRALTVQVVGDPKAAKKVLVTGCIHGNECAGQPILRAVAKKTPPKGVAYVLYAYPNPDGTAAKIRHNAHKVDLNRNFIGWKANGRPGYVYYPGPGALSEPESLAIYDLVRSAKPTAFVSYHQALKVIDYAGTGGAKYAPGYASRAGLPVKVLPAYPGSNATWLGTRYPDIVTLTVELSRPAPTAMLTRNVTALTWLAGAH